VGGREIRYKRQASTLSGFNGFCRSDKDRRDASDKANLEHFFALSGMSEDATLFRPTGVESFAPKFPVGRIRTAGTHPTRLI